jgi:hypothetical protein
MCFTKANDATPSPYRNGTGLLGFRANQMLLPFLSILAPMLIAIEPS